jgi:hypothetical protein
MSEEELIAEATKIAKQFREVDLNDLPRRRVRETVTIYFGSDHRNDYIEVSLDKKTGELISGTYSPRN